MKSKSENKKNKKRMTIPYCLKASKMFPILLFLLLKVFGNDTVNKHNKYYWYNHHFFKVLFIIR
jgi:hypothetical protein